MSGPPESAVNENAPEAAVEAVDPTNEAKAQDEEIVETTEGAGADGGVALVVAPPSQERPPDVAPRPVKKLPPSYMDLSSFDNNEDCLDLSPVGPPRRAVTVLRKKKPEVETPKKAAAVTPQPTPKKEEPEPEVWELVLSERAQRETALLDVLPTREFTMSDHGKLELDDHPNWVGRSSHLDANPEIDFEVGGTGPSARGSLYNELMGRASVSSDFSARPSERPSRFSRLNDTIAEDLIDGDGGAQRAEEASRRFESFCEWQQRLAFLQDIRHALREQALLGKLSANTRALVALTGAGGGENGFAVALGAGVGMDELPPGSEPPPTPAVQRRRRLVTNEAEDEETEKVHKAIDERYENACAVVGCQTKVGVLQVLRTLENGAQSLPLAFSHSSYLGNRGAQALFLALAANHEDVGVESGQLPELKHLDLQGQGLGNEAAIALASLLPRCPQLRSVNLARNHVSETGAQMLLEEIQLHPSVDMMNLDQNPVPSWLRVQLKQVMATRMDDPWHDTSARKMLRHMLNQDDAASPRSTMDRGSSLTGPRASV